MTEGGIFESWYEERRDRKHKKIGDKLVERMSQEAPPPSRFQRWRRGLFKKPDGTPRYTLIAVLTRWMQSRRRWETALGGLLGLVGGAHNLVGSAGMWQFAWLCVVIVSIGLLYRGLQRRPPTYQHRPRRRA